MMATHARRSSRPEWVTVARIVIGMIWLAGAAFNVMMTLRMSRPFEWLEASPIPVYRWFFRDIAGRRPVFWTLLLIAAEVTLGVLTLARGSWARLGLAGGALFSLFLVSLGTFYTLMMAPYALLLAWLARRDSTLFPFDQRRLRPERRAPAG